MERFPKSLSARLEARIADGSLRQLPVPNTLADFASNDYLGLARNSGIFEAAHELLTAKGLKVNGATGSRLISGNHSLYSEAEAAVANFHNAESALIFNSGYDANMGFFSSVPQKGDVVLYDEHIHASVRDGLRQGNAGAYKFKHNSLGALKMMMERHRDKAAEVYVVTESVFSMDGDSPDLEGMLELCNENQCRLVVDEAHAAGVFGDNGEGLVQKLGIEEAVFARVITFGKALGCHGAAIAGSEALKNYLVNFARSLIYTTALPPHALATIISAYKHLSANSGERAQLHKNTDLFISETQRLGITGFIAGNSAIHCIVIPGNERVKNIAGRLKEYGYNVKPILSPTVPAGQERLRFCLHSFNTHAEITGVLQQLKTLL